MDGCESQCSQVKWAMYKSLSSLPLVTQLEQKNSCSFIIQENISGSCLRIIHLQGFFLSIDAPLRPTLGFGFSGSDLCPLSLSLSLSLFVTPFAGCFV